MDSKETVNQSDNLERRYSVTGIVAVTLAIVGLIQFVIVAWIAIGAYPGDKVPGQYSLVQNFFSDLGMARSWTGEDNSYGAFWFNTALTSLGVMLMPLFAILPWAGKRDSISMWFASFCGIVSALGLIGLGQLPIDEHYYLHLVALGFWLFPMFAMATAFFLGAVKTEDLSVWFLGAGLLAVAFMIAVPLITGTTNHAINQKIIALYGLIWFGFVIWFVSKSTVLCFDHDYGASVDEIEDEYFVGLSKKLRS